MRRAIVGHRRSPTWHRKLRKKRSLARGYIWFCRGRPRLTFVQSCKLARCIRLPASTPQPTCLRCCATRHDMGQTAGPMECEGGGMEKFLEGCQKARTKDQGQGEREREVQGGVCALFLGWAKSRHFAWWCLFIWVYLASFGIARGEPEVEGYGQAIVSENPGGWKHRRRSQEDDRGEPERDSTRETTGTQSRKESLDQEGEDRCSRSRTGGPLLEMEEWHHGRTEARRSSPCTRASATPRGNVSFGRRQGHNQRCRNEQCFCRRSRHIRASRKSWSKFVGRYKTCPILWSPWSRGTTS